MFSEISALIKFINLNPDLKTLISSIQNNNNDFWLVGGCLRNFLLDLPQVDIDIACSGDPTILAKKWATAVMGRWFWLDSKRKQSRVLLSNGLTVDFTPLRAPSIKKDLQLRDFTINALALHLDASFPDSDFFDPLAGVNHLQERQLHTCSDQSFPDDPLRMMKGIRHAVTLDFDISADTRRQILSSAHLLANVSGERIRDELGKILASENVVNGIELLIDTGLLGILLGPPGNNWDRHAAIDEINRLNVKIQEIELAAEKKLFSSEKTELFSTHVIFLFAQLLKRYSPSKLPDVLHNRLRLSRTVQRLLEELQTEPDLNLFSLAASIEGQRRQALVFEQMEPFAGEKMLFWGVCCDLLSLEKVLELQKSFNAEQKLGRIPDLLNGRLIASLLVGSPDTEIGEWQSKLKQAEIDGEISTDIEAENWLESNLDP